MELWVVYALVSMVFAGVTAVIAKQGLEGITGELGLAVRTAFVFVFVLIFTASAVPAAQFHALTTRNLLWLALSAATTFISWLYYYKALQLGEVSTIALIDKGSVVITVALAWALLGDPLTLRTTLGTALIVAGLFVLSGR